MDATADWSSSPAIIAPPQNGQLQLKTGEFCTSTTSGFDGLVTVDADFKADQVASEGWLLVPFGAGGSRFGQLRIRTTRSSDTSQTTTLETWTGASFETLMIVRELSANTIQHRLVIDPKINEVGWWVNERFRGRFSVNKDRTSSLPTIQFGALNGLATFDFLSVRVGSQP